MTDHQDPTDARLEALLRYDAEPPLDASDELSDRYLVRDIVERFANEDLVEAPQPSRWPARALALAAAALLVGGLALWLLWPTGDEVSSPQPESSSASSSARVVLIGESQVVSPGSAWREGERLDLDRGEVAIQLHEAVVVWLRAPGGGSLTASRLSSEHIALQLDGGDLFVSVDPQLEHPDVTIHTRRGQVHVTGTVFDVRAEDDGVEVEVFRGVVELRADGHVRPLSRGRGGRLGGDETWSLSDARLAQGLERLRAMQSVLGASALLELSTSPPGARFSLDGISFGRAPLATMTPAGRRLLEIEAEGYATIREELHLEHGARLSRTWLLTPLPSEGPWRLGPLRSTGAASLTWLLEHIPVGFSALPAPVAEARAPQERRPPDLEPEPRPTPRQMLRDAQALRRKRDLDGAYRAYLDLADAYPTHDEGRAALVSLGHLQLDTFDEPGEALVSFEQYLLLAPRGALQEEARFGRIRALRDLGRADEAERAMRDFMERFPESIHAFEIEEWRAP